MRRLLLAVFGVVALAGVASAQQPQSYPVPTSSPAAVASVPLQRTGGASVISGPGCSNCGPAAGSGLRGGYFMASGGNCQYGAACQSGCGSLKSDLAFYFGSCKQFFNPCGPTCGGGHGGFLFGSKCGTLPFAQPWGPGWCCPRQYDTYMNH